jgi:hypothetical protein
MTTTSNLKDGDTMTTEGTGTASTKPTAWNLELLFVVLALTAQATMTVELFEAGTVPGKLVSIVGIVLTGLGYTVARAKAVKSVLPTAMFVGIFVLLAATLASGCGSTAGIVTRKAAGDFYDCMKPDATKVALELAGVMDRAVRSAVNNDGTFDRSQLKDAAAPIKEPALRCAFATALNTVGRIVGGSMAQSSPLEVSEQERAAALAEVSALYGGATFRLAEQ